MKAKTTNNTKLHSESIVKAPRGVPVAGTLHGRHINAVSWLRTILTPIPLVVSFLCLTIPFTASSQGVTDGLLAHWSFNGGPQDDSGNGHDGTVNGATLAADAFGVADGAYSFDGVNDRVLIPESSTIDISRMGLWTIAAWVRPTSVANNWPTIYSEGFFGATLGLQSGTGLPQSFINNANAINGTIAVPLNQWSHIALVKDGVSRTFYVNGTFAGSGAAPSATPDNSGSAIGGVTPHHGGGAFAGQIEEVFLYDRALSSDEVRQVGAGEWMITKQPLDQQIPVGADATFTVEIGGPASPSPSYQWYFNNNRIVGATGSTYQIQNIRFSDIGDYHVDVSFLGFVKLRSRIARLSVLEFAIAVYPAIEIEFPSEAGKTYTVQYSTDLISWFDQEGETSIPGTGQLIKRCLSTRETAGKYFRAVEN